MALSEGLKPAERTMLTGRGGAGNFGPRSPRLDPADLKTPVIKSDLYTTGRGGTGNMALNLHSHPELARASQDVETAPNREPQNSVHYGRGGAANIAHISDEAKASAKERNEKRRRSEATGVVGQFGRETKETKEKEKEAAEGKAENDKGKGKNLVEKGIHKLTRVMSSNGQAKK